MKPKETSLGPQENRFPNIVERRQEHKDVPYEKKVNGEDFKQLRFRADWGPESLFHRIEVKFKNRKKLEFNTHGTERTVEREFTPDIISYAINFEPKKWKLVQASVSPESYRFVTAVWERTFGNDKIWLVIGMYHQIVSIYRKDLAWYGQDKVITKKDPLFQKVDQVNLELNRQDGI